MIASNHGAWMMMTFFILFCFILVAAVVMFIAHKNTGKR